MPYFRCPACGLTVHGASGRFTRSVCPNCAEPLTSGDQVHIAGRHPAAISRRFIAERGAASEARHELETIMWCLDDDEFQTLTLLVSELITNSVKHSNAGVYSEVRLDVVATRQLIRVEVRDDGHGFEPLARTADSPYDSHWGLYLVEELSDRWQVLSGAQTLVWFEIDRAADQESGHLLQPHIVGAS
jgi:anti-sigma regulatory factor (Ser/Thr protein kinase)